MNLQPRMIYTEGKAKVVAAAWGKEFIQIPCRASYLAPGIIHPFLHNILVQFILFFISSWCKELTTFYPPNTSDDLCLLFCTVQFSSMNPPLPSIVAIGTPRLWPHTTSLSGTWSSCWTTSKRHSHKITTKFPLSNKLFKEQQSVTKFGV